MFFETRDRIATALQELTGEEDVLLADGGEHADLASTVAFPLAKKRRQAPAAIAQDARGRARPAPRRRRRHGRGDRAVPELPVRRRVPRERRAGPPSRRGTARFPPKRERVVLEHTSANPNGPLHVGHIRNSVIGDTLARAFRKAGYSTEVQYYVNDMGRQIAIVVWGMDHLGIEAEPGEKPDAYTARVYVEANRRIEADPAITAEVDALMQQVEAQDPATVKKFRTVVARCLDGFKETLAALATPHDRYVWESDFLRIGDMERLLLRFVRRKEAHQDEVFWIDLSAFGIKNRYVLRRSDGTSVYAARDLAYHVWKARNADRVIDVLGADHKLIGASLQAALRLLGEKPPEIVFFEFVSLPEGSMSTRAGKFVPSDDLIAETRRRAFEEVTVRRPELPEEERHGHRPLGRARRDPVRHRPGLAREVDRLRLDDRARLRAAVRAVRPVRPRPGLLDPREGRRRLERGVRATTRRTSRPSPGRSRSSRSSWPRRSRSSGPTSSRRTPASSRTSSTPSTTSSPCSGPRGGPATPGSRWSGPRRTRSKRPSRPSASMPSPPCELGRAALARQGYLFVDRRSTAAVKPCLWCRRALGGGETCYKQQFYGIESHRCVQMTPTLRCNQRCLFCWRSFEHEPTEEVELAPEALLAALPRLQKQALAGYKVHVAPERFDEGADPRHVAVSLAGEPTLYSQLPALPRPLHGGGHDHVPGHERDAPLGRARLPAVPDLRLARRAGRGDVPLRLPPGRPRGLGARAREPRPPRRPAARRSARPSSRA